MVSNSIKICFIFWIIWRSNIEKTVLRCRENVLTNSFILVSYNSANWTWVHWLASSPTKAHRTLFHVLWSWWKLQLYYRVPWHCLLSIGFSEVSKWTSSLRLTFLVVLPSHVMWAISLHTQQYGIYTREYAQNHVYSEISMRSEGWPISCQQSTWLAFEKLVAIYCWEGFFTFCRTYGHKMKTTPFEGQLCMKRFWYHYRVLVYLKKRSSPEKAIVAFLKATIAFLRR